ncbi:MAG: ankyrin repeat domain-containing protein [Gemmatimonadaceae bacterium]
MPNTPFASLSAAVRANDVDAAGQLLQAHPQLSARLNEAAPDGAFGETVLLSAVASENREMVDLLLRHGADIDARSHWWAGSFGVLDGCDPEFAAFLIERGATVDAHAAARLGMLDVLQRHVAANPDVVRARGGDGQTPLHFASTVEIATYLLAHGADMNALDVDHESTPAQYMVRDRQDIARLLVTRGCTTDILMAAALDATDLVRRYLDDDPATVQTRVSRKFFPMRHPHAGGSIYTWTLGSEKSAHVIAHEFGHEDVFQLLMQRSSDTTKLVVACEVGDDALVRSLLQENAYLARSLSSGEQSRIVGAAQGNDTAAVRLMIDAGWPLDARGDLGGTALHHAAWMGNAEIVRDLLEHGAPVGIRGDTYDMTPLGWALHGSEHSWRKDTGDYDEVVQLLLDAGAVMPTLTTEIP